jgi:hypothetical protein
MGRLNNGLKFALINVNIIFCTMGLFLIAMSIYLLTGNFGKLDPGFFLGTGLVIIFIGLSISVGACLGCQGANNQNEKFGRLTFILICRINIYTHIPVYFI